MNSDRFTDYIERGLSFEGSGGSNVLQENERLAWELHDCGGPAGKVLLGDALLRTRISYLRKDVKAVPFARKLLEEGFAALSVKDPKEHWDWYYLGLCHELGRGTPVNHTQAAECFRNAKDAGNAYAEYEEMWSAFLGGTAAIETILQLRIYSGRLKEFAKRSAVALALLEMGPVREIGGGQHMWRILELSNCLREDYYHKAGGAHISVNIEKEFRLDVDSLKSMKTPCAALILFLISERSRSNPTGEQPDVWLCKATHPENSHLLSLVPGNNLSDEHLHSIVEVCIENRWQTSELCRVAQSMLEQIGS